MTSPAEVMNEVTAEIVEEVGEANVLAFAVVVVHKQGKGINWAGHIAVDNYPQAVECEDALDTILADLKDNWGLNMGRAQGTA